MDVKKLKLKRDPSKGALSKMLKQQEHNRIKAFAEETNQFMLQKKGTKASQFPKLEDKLSFLFRRIEINHGVLTNDITLLLQFMEARA
jgi:hypothetical protein